jgi:hypothetical protein
VQSKTVERFWEGQQAGKSARVAVLLDGGKPKKWDSADYLLANCFRPLPRLFLRAAAGAPKKTCSGTVHNEARGSPTFVRMRTLFPERARRKSVAIQDCRKSRSARKKDCAAVRAARETALRILHSATAKFPQRLAGGQLPTGVWSAGFLKHDRPDM